MVERIIHYCWFGKNPLPDSAKRCIASWKRVYPDWSIKQWNESNFDVNMNAYVKEAYEAKKWAFVSDYARFWILKQEGGVYFDTDVELLKSIDDILDEGAFMGVEAYSGSVASGLGIGFEKDNPILDKVLEYYEKKHFINADGTYDLTTVCVHVTRVLEELGYVQEDRLQKLENCTVYPSDYFCPQDFISKETKITENSRSIHHYDSTWYTDEERYSYEIKKKLINYMPRKTAGRLANFVSKCKYKGVVEAIRITIKRLRKA